MWVFWPPSSSFPYGCEAIQMLGDGGSAGNAAGQMAGLRGWASCALAGPHPVALMCLFCSSSTRVPPSLSPLRCRSSAGAVTPVILLSISSLTLSISSHSITGGAACDS